MCIRDSRRAVPVRDVHRRQSAGRYPLRVPEPEDPLLAMSGAAATEITLLERRAGERRWPPIVPLAVVVALVLCALLAPVLAPHSPVEGSLGDRLAPPIGLEGAKPGHFLGTDRHGRDTLSRLLYGARISLAVSVVGITLTGAMGAFIGLLAGFFGGWTDSSTAIRMPGSESEMS